MITLISVEEPEPPGAIGNFWMKQKADVPNLDFMKLLKIKQEPIVGASEIPNAKTLKKKRLA